MAIEKIYRTERSTFSFGEPTKLEIALCALPFVVMAVYAGIGIWQWAVQ